MIKNCYVRQESGSRVVFGKNRQRRPPPMSRAATINVGAGQYMSSKVAITMLPIIPPRRAATIDTATPVALKHKILTKPLTKDIYRTAAIDIH